MLCEVKHLIILHYLNILTFTKSALKCYVNITGTYQGKIVLKTTKSPRFRKSYENVTWSNENYKYCCLCTNQRICYRVSVSCVQRQEKVTRVKKEKKDNLTKMWKWRHGFWINQRRQNREVLEMWKWVGSRQDFHAEHVSRKGCFAVKNVQFGWHKTVL